MINYTAMGKDFEFDVALSYANEDKKFVDCVARQLREHGLRVYYDKYEQIDQWGQNLYDHLSNVYFNKARYCVLFISKHYKEKSWTRHERIHAQARAMEETRAYILPFRLDDTDMPGLPNTTKYLSRQDYNCKQLGEALLLKIQTGTEAEVSGITNSINLVSKVRKDILNKKGLIAISLLITGFTTIGFRDRLTPVNTLAKRIHERSKQVIKGSICKDGRFSYSRGPGTCSHHEGVKEPYDSVIYNKTMKESMEEAKEVSWLSP